MLKSYERCLQRKSIVHFIRRTVVLRLLPVPFAVTKYSYDYIGNFKEIYVFGIRVMGFQYND